MPIYAFQHVKLHQFYKFPPKHKLNSTIFSILHLVSLKQTSQQIDLAFEYKEKIDIQIWNHNFIILLKFEY